MIKNKTFFFFNYEGDRRRTGSTISSTVPNPPELTGDFSQRKDVSIKDPVTGNPFPGNIIPANRIDPIGLAFAKYYPAPNVAFDPTRAPNVNFIVNASDALTRDFYTGRVDHTFSDNDRAFVRVFRLSQPTVTASIFPCTCSDPRSGLSNNNGYQILGDWLHNFGPTLFHEFHYMNNASLSAGTDGGCGSGPQQGKLGLTGVDPTFAPTISLTGFTWVDGNQQAKGPSRVPAGPTKSSTASPGSRAITKLNLVGNTATAQSNPRTPTSLPPAALSASATGPPAAGSPACYSDGLPPPRS